MSALSVPGSTSIWPGGAADAELLAVAVYPQVADRRQLAEPGGMVSMPTPWWLR